jgi:glycosyltransferase involved in cell wall biosynthesis
MTGRYKERGWSDHGGLCNLKFDVDVAVCTYESERYLDQCLASIEKTVPFNRLIIVDKYSKDRTVEIAKDHGAEIFFENIGLGHARQVAIDNTKAPFLLFVDSDVVFYDDLWFHEAVSLFTENGKIGAIGIWTPSKLPAWRRKYVDYWWRNVPYTSKPGFGNVYFYRRKAIEGVKNISDRCEQVFLLKYVSNRGYRVLVIRGNGLHYFEMPDDKALWMGAGSRSFDTVKTFPRTLIMKIAIAPFKAIPPALVYKDPSIVVKNTEYWWKYLKGWLRYDKYTTLQK